MAKIYDLTVPLSPQLATFPGDPPFQSDPVYRIRDGHPCNVSRLTLGTHAGTHVDAPRHFLEDGARVDELPLEILTGKARVVSIPAREAVDRADLEALDLRDDLRLLIRTRNSGQLRQPEFRPDFVYLTPEAASYLVQVGIKLVGWDYLSIEKFGSRDFPAHHALLGAGVILVEGLDLSQVEAGEYELTCLPLKVAGGDGAPARVIVRSRP
ncbi:MAG TPA: cyclase family protein [Vicinamibacteria bacterium]|nr:cyclase family protein [Vicinamibacteria bacterium]